MSVAVLVWVGCVCEVFGLGVVRWCVVSVVLMLSVVLGWLMVVGVCVCCGMWRSCVVDVCWLFGCARPVVVAACVVVVRVVLGLAVPSSCWFVFCVWLFVVCCLRCWVFVVCFVCCFVLFRCVCCGVVVVGLVVWLSAGLLESFGCVVAVELCVLCVWL